MVFGARQNLTLSHKETLVEARENLLEIISIQFEEMKDKEPLLNICKNADLI